MVLDSTQQLIFNKLPLTKFWHSKKEYLQLFLQATKILFPFPTTFCVRPDFLHMLQPKQQNKTDWCRSRNENPDTFY